MIDLDQGWIERIIKWLNATARLTTGALASPTGSDTNVVTGTAGSANDQAVWDANGDVVALPIAAFSAYHDTTQSTGNATFAAVSFNTEEYDYGGNFASSAFTAPVDGVYHFSALVRTQDVFTQLGIALYVDTGSGYAEVKLGGNEFHNSTTNTAFTAVPISTDLSLSSGDSVKVYSRGDSALTLQQGSSRCYFNGHLVRAT